MAKKKDLISETSTINVARTIKKNRMEKDESEEDVIAVHSFVTEPARVSVDYSMTLNLGNYESARISVAVQMPCYKEEIDDAYEFASQWAGERMAKEKDLFKKSKKSNKNPL